MSYELHGQFYENEQPELVDIVGGEVRFYKDAKRLSFSKNPWIDGTGKLRIGKTVTVNLELNAGDTELIQVLEKAVAILKGGNTNGKNVGND